MADLFLEYGDIIHITSETEALNEKKFHIDYIDARNFIRIVNEDTIHIIDLDEDGSFRDKTIMSVNKIYSSPLKGFALQNELIIGKMIEIMFKQEDYPVIVGLITNLENDRIEIKLDSDELIYIDFEYKGMHLFVNHITIINESTDDDIEPDLPIVDNVDILPDTIEEHIPEQADINKELIEQYKKGEITFGDTIKITIQTEKGEAHKRHSIEAQVTHLVDTLLSTIPNNQRTEAVLSEVHHIVERYTQLRNTFSNKDEHGSITCSSSYSDKPLASFLTEGKVKTPKWILPVISAKTKLYMTIEESAPENDTDDKSKDINVIGYTSEVIKCENGLQQKYRNKELSFLEYTKKVNELYIPYSNDTTSKSILCNQIINDDQETMLLGATVCKAISRTESEWVTNDSMTQKLITSPYTKNETKNINSFVMLSDIMAEYSKINLNNLSIMTRSAMNKNHIPSSITHKNTNKTITGFEEINYNNNRTKQLCLRINHIENYDEHIQIANQQKLIQIPRTEDKMKPLKGLNVIKKNKRMTFLDTTYKLENNDDDDDKFAKYLYTIVPATTDLIKLCYIDRIKNKQTTKNYSFIEIVNQYLEPFMIYSKNIHFGEGYYFIREVIKEKINQYIKDVEAHKSVVIKKLGDLKKVKKNEFNPTSINEFIKDVFKKKYDNTKLQHVSSTELLSGVFDIDGIFMMSNVIYAKNLKLVMNPAYVEDVIVVKSNLKIEDKLDCPHKFIAKKYSSIDDLTNDNGKDLFYDVGFDDTPYELLQNYKKQQNMENFIDFLKEQLVSKHSCPKTAADELAKTLIRGKKQVVEGEYALLSEDGGNNYYKRNQHKKWVLARGVKFSEFINNNELFCNINDRCIKNDKSKTCDSITEHRNVYVAEFKSRLDALDNKLRKENEGNIEKLSGIISRNQNLKYIQSHRQNNLSVEYSKTLPIDNTLQSPHTMLRDLILSHKNFPEKQNYLISFAKKYTRIHNSPESEHWLYCVATNTKLIPSFLIKLAKTFKNYGAEEYRNELEFIKSESGVEDSDGAYYDKNSGYKISKMEYANTDEYTESGSLITTHSILHDTDEIPTVIFHPSTKIIDSIFNAICYNLDIEHKKNEFRDFVHQKTIIMIGLLRTEREYISNIENAKKISQEGNRKNVPSTYEVYVNGNIIFTVSCLILILLQTSYPSIEKRKTFEECVQSFSGHPNEDEKGDESGLKYLACAILKMKSSISPWDAIKSIRENIFIEKMKYRLTELLTDKNKNYGEIIKLYTVKKIKEKEQKAKKEEEKERDKEREIEKEKDKERDKKSKYSLNIGDKFEQEGAIIKNQIIVYGNSIIESINNIVKTKVPVQKKDPKKEYTDKREYCCYEKKDAKMTALQYFIGEDENMSSLIAKSIQCEKELSVLRLLSVPYLSVYLENTKNKVVENSFPKQHINNITQAFIHYLKYDTKYPVPYDFNDMYVKPDKYKSNMTIDQKANVLENDNANYDINALDKLLKIVFSKNMVSGVAITNDDTTYDESNKFTRFATSVLENVHIEDIIRGTTVDVMHKMTTTNNTDFLFYMNNINHDMRNDILEYVRAHKTGSSRSANQAWSSKLDNMTKISTWNLYIEDKEHHSTILSIVQNAIFKMCKVYPSFIINEKRGHHEIITKRWGLSSKHLDHLENFRNDNLFTYLNNNEVDKDVFSGDLTELENIILLSKNIPRSQKFDRENFEALLTYSWLSVFRVFITSATQLSVDDNNHHYVHDMIEILSSFLDMETKNKKLLDISIEQVQKNSFSSKLIEKKKFTDALKNLDRDGRKLMKEMQKIGLGMWREGKIGLVNYDPDAYDRNSTLISGIEPNLDLDNPDIVTDDHDVENEEQNGYDSGDGDGNDDNDNDFDN